MADKASDSASDNSEGTVQARPVKKQRTDPRQGVVCCVPKCGGNADAANKVSVHRFPNPNDARVKSLAKKQELAALLQQWLKRIPRDWPEGFDPSKTKVRVCARHFPKHDLVRQSDGQWVPRPGAVPSIFAGHPKYYNVPSQPPRADPENRAVRMERNRREQEQAAAERERERNTLTFSALVARAGAIAREHAGWQCTLVGDEGSEGAHVLFSLPVLLACPPACTVATRAAVAVGTDSSYRAVLYDHTPTHVPTDYLSLPGGDMTWIATEHVVAVGRASTWALLGECIQTVATHKNLLPPSLLFDPPTVAVGPATVTPDAEVNTSSRAAGLEALRSAHTLLTAAARALAAGGYQAPAQGCVFLAEQAQLLGRPATTHRHGPATMQVASTVHGTSRKAYDKLRALGWVVLPSERNMRRKERAPMGGVGAQGDEGGQGGEQGEWGGVEGEGQEDGEDGCEG